MSLQREIFEQPEALARLLEAERATVTRLVDTLRHREVRYVVIAARGTSLNAGRYAAHLWGTIIGWPVVLAYPSLHTIYHRPPNMRDALVVGISQSGQSPDIVSVVQAGRQQGAFTLAITNTPDSPLAQAADEVLFIHAGPERAVAATKTYTAQLTAVAMMAAAWQDDQTPWQELLALPDHVQAALQSEGEVSRWAERYRFMERCVILGRGYELATAFEWALKITELSYVQAQPFSVADFQHGPVALVESGFPVFVVATAGAPFAATLEFLVHLRDGLNADVAVLSDQRQALDLAHTPLPVPAGVPEWLRPVVSIVPAQLFAYHLTRIKELNTESPRHLRKVTETL